MGEAIVIKIAGAAFAASAAGTAVAFAINLVASTVLSKIFAPDAPNQNNAGGGQPNPGNRQQLAPAGDNKLPVVYGTAYVGGAIIDMSISQNNQDIYWVFALSEVTNTENGGTPDTITFGDIYWGGKKCVFSTVAGEEYKVTGLLDESTNETQNIKGYMDIWLYNNGSNSPVNSTSNAVSVMNSSGLVYTWNGDKQMTNTAFAIVHLRYSQSRNLVGLNQTRFQLTNSRKAPGDCFLDYLTSVRYGAAIPLAQIDTDSLDELNAYSNAPINYITYTGGGSTLPRFQFNGTVDTSQKIMQNLQSMADSCDCLLKYNEINATWGVIVQKPTYTVAMALNDSNIVSAISVSPIDISNSFNQIEVKFPDGSEKDTFNSATFDLAVLNPSLLFPNEPVNKQSVNLYLINNNVTAQYIANRMLESAREDLQIQLDIDYTGLQLEAGDIVTVTNANYGWDEKIFRIMKVIEKFGDDGQVTASLSLSEFNPSVYDDYDVTQFTPAPNTGIGSPTAFGSIPAPVIGTLLPNAANPAFSVIVTTSSSGITQYAEIWYSAFEFPTESQRIFAGTTEVNASGDPYDINTVMPAVQLFNIPAGNWYFFSRMVNNIASSDFSLASNVVQWRPTTFQFVDRYLSVAYADAIDGTGFSLNPRNKSYYGLANQDSTTPSLTASDYKWYLADPLFGTNIYLVFQNYTNRKFGFDTDFAAFAGGTGLFVPSTSSKFDFRLWSALEDGINIIDLDKSTGQVIETGTTTGTVNTGQIAVKNTNDGQLIASLDVFLPQLAEGQYLTGSAATLTIDRYGRVVGFSSPDEFYFTAEYFTATSGQTVFTPTARDADYITGQDLIFQNGLLLNPTSDYTETSSTFTLNTGATTDDIISVMSMRAVSSQDYYAPLFLSVDSSSTNTVVWTSTQMPFQLINVGDELTFSNTGTPTSYTVTAVDYVTRTITFSSNPTVSAGASIYRYRAMGASYPAFSRFNSTLTNAGAYTPTEWAIRSGYEVFFLNGTIVNEQDYDISSGSVTNFPASATGNLVTIQFAGNNLNVPIGNMANVVVFTASGIATYSFNYNANAFNLFANGCLFKPTADYTTSTNSYTITPTPTNASTILVQQTFASAGAA